MSKKNDELSGLETTERSFVIITLIFTMVAAIILTILFFYRLDTRIEALYSKLQFFDERTSRIEKDIENILKHEKGIVNLRVPTIQKIGSGFFVAKLVLETHLTGVKIRGIIINSNALGHQDLKFRIAIADQTKEFPINKISSGGSKDFEVYVPDVPLEKAATAQIQLTESSISYYKD